MVLIILATVSINAVMGENGIIKKAEQAGQYQANAEASDSEALDEYDQYIVNSLAGSSENGGSTETYLGLTITSQTEGVDYKDKDGNVKELTEEIEDGDIIQYGDYEYRYNEYFLDFDNGDIFFTDWTENTEQNGWGVRVIDDTKESYGEICGTILDNKVNNGACQV